MAIEKHITRKWHIITLQEAIEYLDHCEVGGIVQGDEGPVCGVAQVVDCHGVTVGHQEKGEEVEKQEEVEGEGETLKEHCTWME